MNKTKISKGYKQTEVGVIPKDWKVIPMSSLFSFKNGFNADKNAYGTGTKFINVMDIFNNQEIRWKDISGKVALNKSQITTYKVAKYDILFNRTSETFEEIALASIYLDDEDVVFGGFVIRGVHISDEIYPNFSLRVLHSSNVRKQLILKAQGAIRANIGQLALSKALLPIPPLHEQKAIAQVLTDTDNLIQTLQQKIAKKRAIKQGAMQELLKPKEGWEVKKLGELVFNISSGSSNTINENGDFKLYGSTGVISTKKNNDYAGEKILIARVGANAGSLYKVNGKYCVSDNTLMITCSTELSIEYGFYFLKYFNLNKLVFGSGQPLITGSQLKEIEVPLPLKQEQTQITTILSDMDTEITQLEEKLQKYQVLKQGLMQSLLTGKIRLL